MNKRNKWLRLVHSIMPALLLLASTALAQDYRLPPTVKGSPAAPSKPEIDYRIPSSGRSPAAGQEPPIHQLGGPYIRLHNVKCAVQDHSYGTATGEIENISKQALNQIEVTVTWQGGGARGVRHPAVPVKSVPLKPGERASFHSAGRVPGTARECNANVTVR